MFSSFHVSKRKNARIDAWFREFFQSKPCWLAGGLRMRGQPGAPVGAPNHYSQMARRSYEGIGLANSMTPATAMERGGQAPAADSFCRPLALVPSANSTLAVAENGRRPKLRRIEVTKA